MNKLICLLGKSGSGKSTIESILEERYGYKRAISTTTRPMREGEKHGVNYHYVSEEVFANMLANNEVLEYTTYNNWNYALTKGAIDLESDTYIAVIERKGYEQLVKNFGRKNIISFLIEVDDKERLIRSLIREEKPNCKEICRRFLADTLDFEGLEDEVDHVVKNNTLDSSVTKIHNVLSMLKQIQE